MQFRIGKNNQNLIESKYEKRLDLDHIENIMNDAKLRALVIPDFGFNFLDMNLKTVDGWKKLMQYIKYPYKYERVENYVAARQLIKDKIQMLSQLKKSLLVNTLHRKNELVK